LTAITVERHLQNESDDFDNSIPFEMLRDAFVLKTTTKYAQSVIARAVVKAEVTYIG
jgi:hypothetical protein